MGCRVCHGAELGGEVRLGLFLERLWSVVFIRLGKVQSGLVRTGRSSQWRLWSRVGKSEESTSFSIVGKKL